METQFWKDKNCKICGRLSGKPEVCLSCIDEGHKNESDHKVKDQADAPSS